MKYKLTQKTIKNLEGKTFFQIEATESFGSIKKGELGGCIESEANLSQEGNAWVYDNAWVYGNAQVYDNAQVHGDSRVYGDSRVFGNAWVWGNAQVCGDARVYGNAKVYGDSQVYGYARVYGDARVFDNAQVYGDSRVYGDSQVYGYARVCAKVSLTKGWFIGGNDSGKITDITDKTGTTYWKHQYVIGDYEITSIDENKEESLSGREVTVTVGNKTYKAIIL